MSLKTQIIFSLYDNAIQYGLTEENVVYFHWFIPNYKASIKQFFARVKNPNTIDTEGKTALHFFLNINTIHIIRKQFRNQSFYDVMLDIVNYLLYWKIDINLCDNHSKTALHYAIEQKLPIRILQLLSSSESINIQDNNGKTPLHYAIENNLIAECNFLLNVQNINVNIEDLEHKTALDYALQYNNLEIAEQILLRSNLKKISTKNINDFISLDIIKKSNPSLESLVIELIDNTNNNQSQSREEYSYESYYTYSMYNTNISLSFVDDYNNYTNPSILTDINLKIPQIKQSSTDDFSENEINPSNVNVSDMPITNIEKKHDKTTMLSNSDDFSDSEIDPSEIDIDNGLIAINPEDQIQLSLSSDLSYSELHLTNENIDYYSDENAVIEQLRFLFNKKKYEKHYSTIRSLNTQILNHIFLAHNEETIRFILNKSHNEQDDLIYCKDSYQQTILHYATEVNFIHLIQQIIFSDHKRQRRSGIQQDPQFALINQADWIKRTPLHYSVINNKPEITKIFLDQSSINILARDKYDKTALDYAIEQKNISLVMYFLEKRPSCYDYEDDERQTYLHKIVLNNLTDVLQRHLFDYKTRSILNKQDCYGNTALHYSVLNKSLETMKILQAMYANINCQNKQGQTVLHIAVENDSFSMVRSLVSNKINIDTKDQLGNPALHYAIINNNSHILNHLLKNKADINIQNNCGRTALHLAVLNNSLPMVKALMCNKINLECKDKYGKTVLDYARDNKNYAILKLIMEKKHCSPKSFWLTFGKTIFNQIQKNQTIKTDQILNETRNAMIEYDSMRLWRTTFR